LLGRVGPFDILGNDDWIIGKSVCVDAVAVWIAELLIARPVAFGG
jgi:hypothetical protein